MKTIKAFAPDKNCNWCDHQRACWLWINMQQLELPVEDNLIIADYCSKYQKKLS